MMRVNISLGNRRSDDILLMSEQEQKSYSHELLIANW